jgi:hypothetical protein
LCFELRASFLAARHDSDDDLQLIERRYRQRFSSNDSIFSSLWTAVP